MNRQTKKSAWAKAGIAVAFLIFLDQITKYMAQSGLKDQPSIPIIKGVFELSYVENRGAAFGIMQNQQWFFILVTAVVLAALGWIFHKLPVERRYLPLSCCMTALTAGAVGNLIDRVRLNYVVDFFYFKLIDFPVFNVADIYVVVSIILIALLILFYYKEEELDEIMKG